jgi:hypothetical protein
MPIFVQARDPPQAFCTRNAFSRLPTLLSFYIAKDHSLGLQSTGNGLLFKKGDLSHDA